MRARNRCGDFIHTKNDVNSKIVRKKVKNRKILVLIHSNSCGIIIGKDEGGRITDEKRLRYNMDESVRI